MTEAESLDILGERIDGWITKVHRPLSESSLYGKMSYRYRGAVLIDGIVGADLYGRFDGFKLCRTRGRWILISGSCTDANGNWTSDEIVDAEDGDREAIAKILNLIPAADIFRAALSFGAKCEERLRAGVKRQQDDLRMLTELASPIFGST